MPTINKNEDFPEILITHVPTGKSVSFSPYLESFSDNFNSEWEDTYVFGRMDDIKNFKRTKRVISLGWNVISENTSDARKNYENCSLLMAMLYPVYQSTTTNGGAFSSTSPVEIDISTAEDEIAKAIAQIGDDAANPTFGVALSELNEKISEILSTQIKGTTTQTGVVGSADIKARQASVMSSPPLFKINFANLIRNSGGRELYGVIEGFKYEPDTEMGYFIDGKGKNQMMYPKIVNLSFAFTVIHTQPLGWKYDEKDGYKLRNADFPFYKKK